jgi:hypothetical protein
MWLAMRWLQAAERHYTQKKIITHRKSSIARVSSLTYVPTRCIATESPTKSAAGCRIGASFRACLTFRQEYPPNVGAGGNCIYAEAATVR